MSSSEIPAPVFIEHQPDGGASSVRCPRCKGLFVHLLSKEIRLSGWEDYPEGGGGFRGQYIVLPFHCELCGDFEGEPESSTLAAGFHVFMQFHKGQTFLWARVVRPITEAEGDGS